MVEKRKKGLWEDVGRKTNEDFDGGMKQMWLGIKGIIGNRAGKTVSYTHLTLPTNREE